MPIESYHSNAHARPITKYKCDKCDNLAEFSSKLNGEFEYKLCRKHYELREKEKNK
jgi:hypothetical protein